MLLINFWRVDAPRYLKTFRVDLLATSISDFRFSSSLHHPVPRQKDTLQPVPESKDPVEAPNGVGNLLASVSELPAWVP